MQVSEQCKKAKEAANSYSSCSEEKKNNILRSLKGMILAEKEGIILNNERDLQLARKEGKPKAFIDRLMLNEKRIIEMAEGLDAIIALKDPVGEVTEEYVLSNQLIVRKVRAPLGVIGIIFEARPNVSVDAAALCIKSGNGVVLRGSKDSSYSVAFLISLIKNALEENGVPNELVANIDSSNRASTLEMLKQEGYIDVVIPRGGEALKKVVQENAKMSVVASAGGNCHIYVSSSANLTVARKVIVNAKVSRPSVCNALETILIDKGIASSFLPVICNELKDKGVEIRVTSRAKENFAEGVAINDDELYKEYEDMLVKVDIVSGIKEAISHINKYGTHHSEGIISENSEEIELFMKEVDSCALYLNSSTRFTDGFQLGLGAEMGISTQKLHVRGPIGLKELTSVKYCVYGNGQIRE